MSSLPLYTIIRILKFFNSLSSRLSLGSYASNSNFGVYVTIGCIWQETSCLQTKTKGHEQSRNMETCSTKKALLEHEGGQVEQVYEKPIKFSFLAKHP